MPPRSIILIKQTTIEPINMNLTNKPHLAPPRHAGRCTGLCALVLAVSGLSAHGSSLVPVTHPINYGDGRPYPAFRMDAVDQGKFLDYGHGPNQCDYLGAREALINDVNGTYYLYYDGAGPAGWVTCLAESTDLTTWDLKGPVIDFGAPGTADSACACSPWIIQDDSNLWHMYYLATPNTTGGADKVPIFPYTTLHATSASPAGPWTKHYSPVPFTTQRGTYYSNTASPGHVVKQGSEYLMLISTTDSNVKRTLSIARTTDLNGVWTVDPTPALPVTEQIENSSLYYEPTNQTWFMFTNHIGAVNGTEFGTDAVWVYWTKDLNVWNPACKAIVLDGSNCNWSSKCIGMPSVVQVGDKLKIFYDAPGGTSDSSMRRSLGMATLQLPLDISLVSGSTVPVTNGNFETPGTRIGDPWATFGGPWPLTGLPSNYQQVQAVSAGYFTSTVAGGGTWAALISTDDVPLAHPLIQNLPRSVTAGDTLAVTFWLGRQKGTTGGQAVAYFDVGGTKYATTYDTTSLAADSWQSYTLTQTIANSGNLSLGFYGTTTANSWLDNISDVTVTPAVVDPNAPTSSGAALTTFEDTATALAAGNFGYSDPNSSPLAAVQITTLPVLGTLRLNGTPVASGALPLTVLAANISTLTYQSAANGYGTPYTTMGIKVWNANNLWSNYALMTFHVTPVNDPPTSTGNSFVMKGDTVKTFAAADFPFADVETGSTLVAIMVTALPAHGTLKLGGTAITSAPSAAIPVANIGTLTYTPALSYVGNDSFNYQVSDGTLFSADATQAITVTSATDILVQNGSFETPGTGVGGPWFMVGSPWSITSSPSIYQVIQAVAGGYFTRTDTGGGTNIMLISVDDCPLAHPLVQNLSTSVTVGDTLSVTFSIGKAIGAPGGTGVVYFDVAGTKYTMVIDTTGMAANSWQTQTFTQTITNSGNLRLGFYSTSAVGHNSFVDNVSNISVTPAGGGNTPTITGGTLSAALSSTYGTASSPATFTVAGTNMTAGILVTAPTGFEVSQASGSGYGSTTTVGSAGTIGSTTVYVRLAATAPVAGSYNSQNIVLSSSGATSANVTTAASGNSVSKAALSITANNQSKTYGTVQTTPVTGSAAFTASGLQNSETVGTVTLTYANGSLLATDAVGSTSTITPSAAAAGTFAAANYTIGYVSGTLTVVATLPPVAASGGTVTTYTASGLTYNVHTFTSSGTFTVTSGGSVQYLVVGGGGGGGISTGGGGGGGQVATGTLSATAQAYSVTVGGGGATGGYPNGGIKGASSVFGSVTALGGNGSTCQTRTSTTDPAVYSLWASGGGGGYDGAVGQPAAAGNGYAGGKGGNNCTYYNGGGGGGAGGPGGDSVQGGRGGNGGIGISSSITGSAVYYGGGGGGGIFTNGAQLETQGTGGLGGGGNGNIFSGAAAAAGSPNTGGGGGGGGQVYPQPGQNTNGGAGGSGIVIISYVSGPAPGSYAAWASTSGATGQTMDQDHDHDGVPNGIEYFLGGNTNTTGFTTLPGVV
ncbi:MAG: glycine-rich domain-containing protein, partial [Verrucomicrobiota bacterium]